MFCLCQRRTDYAAAVDGIWKGDVVSCFVCVRGELIALPRSRYMERYFGCSFFTTFFLREKESGGKKSAYKGDCAAIRYAPIRRSLPLIYPPLDCSADSDLTNYRPKRSASIMPRVSYLENARIKLSFFTRGWFVHPLLKINITAQYFY